MLGDTSGKPADAALARVARRGCIGLSRNDVIELHDHVGAKVVLDAHHRFGRELPKRAIEMAAELDTVLADRAQRCEREHLEATRVREDGSLPAHEAMQAAELRDKLIAGTEVQMIGVRQNHLRAHRLQIFRVERLYRAERAHGHEGGGADLAVRRAENSRARVSAAVLDCEAELAAQEVRGARPRSSRWS
jgi:hypothetical protein